MKELCRLLGQLFEELQWFPILRGGEKLEITDADDGEIKSLDELLDCRGYEIGYPLPLQDGAAVEREDMIHALEKANHPEGCGGTELRRALWRELNLGHYL